MDLQFTWLATLEDCGVIIYLARYLRGLWIYNLPDELSEKTVNLQFTWFATWEDDGFTIYLARTVDLQFTWWTLWEDGFAIHQANFLRRLWIQFTWRTMRRFTRLSSPRRIIWEVCGFTIYPWNCSGFENIEAHLMKLRFTIGFRGIPTNTMEYYPTSKL